MKRVVMLLVVCCGPACVAQTDGRGARPAGDQPTTTSAPATIPYADAAFGFELQVPAGWEYDRARYQQYRNSIGLLRGRSGGGQRVMQIQIFRIEPDVRAATSSQPARVELRKFEEWLADFSQTLADNGDAAVPVDTDPNGRAAVVKSELWSGPPRSGALLIYQSRMGPSVARTLVVCIPFDPSTVWVFMYTGLAPDEASATVLRREFETIARSLVVHYDPAEVQQLLAAFERGRALIERVRKDGAQARPDETEYWYRIVVGGKSTGYITRRVSREEHDFSSAGAKHRDVRLGLRIRERSWRFSEDGTVRHTRLDMFSGFDGVNELLENQSTQFPAPDVQPQRLLVKTDQVVRKQDVLFSSLTTSLDRMAPEPGKPVNVGPVYLDLAWLRLAPGLLLAPGTPAEAHALATYSTDTRSIVSQTITPLGEKQLERLPEGVKGPVYAFEWREGMAPNTTLLYTDGRGTLVRVVGGDLVVERVTQEAVEREWGRKRDEAMKRFNWREP